MHVTNRLLLSVFIYISVINFLETRFQYSKIHWTVKDFNTFKGEIKPISNHYMFRWHKERWRDLSLLLIITYIFRDVSCSVRLIR